MDRIDHETAVELELGKKGFTGGDSSQGVKPTIVTAEWLNDFQENLIRFIESVGITPVKGNYTQLTEAISSAVSDITQNQDLLNDQTSAVAITGMIFDKNKTKSVAIDFDLERSVTGQTLGSIGRMYAFLKDGNWVLQLDNEIGDSLQVDFEIDASTGQVSYTSHNLSGGSYSGKIRYKLQKFGL